MMAKKRATKHFLFQILSYILIAGGVFALIFFGSRAKHTSTSVINLSQSAYGDVSVDEISELYLAASVAEAAKLEVAPAINLDYYSAISQYNINLLASSSKIEKPTITDTSSYSRGVKVYTVENGDSMESIIAKMEDFGITGLTTDQIRWSNGLKTTAVSAGQTLYIPSVAGIVYTVKPNDTVESIAKKYGSSEELIIAYNDLETDKTLKEGERIILADGSLPETERPEYVPPVVRPQRTYSRRVAYSAGNPYPRGQCTYWAWQWRHDNMGPEYSVPSNLGNARYWNDNARSSYVVDSTPSYGAIFVDETGRYGHVGIVIAVNADGSINTSEMNVHVPGCGWNLVCTRNLPQSTWSSYTFIHQRK